MTRVRIYHDFNKLDPDAGHFGWTTVRAPLVCRGTADDLERLQIELHDGMLVTLYQPDDVDHHGNPDCLEVDATVRRSAKNDYWVGEFIYSELCYRSEKSY